MVKILLISVSMLFGPWTAADNVNVSVDDAQKKVQQIVATFNSGKSHEDVQKGSQKEKDLDVRSVAAAKKNLADYAGTYQSAWGFSLEIKAENGGPVTVTGTDGQAKFTVNDARIEGALLTGTKVFENGTSEKLEGAFIDRAVIETASKKTDRKFGLAVVMKSKKIDGVNVDAMFFGRG